MDSGSGSRRPAKQRPMQSFAAGSSSSPAPANNPPRPPPPELAALPNFDYQLYKELHIAPFRFNYIIPLPNVIKPYFPTLRGVNHAVRNAQLQVLQTIMTFLHKRFCASNQDYFKLLFGANADPRSPFLPADSVVVAALATAPSSAPSTTTAPVSAGGGRVAGAVKRSKGPEDAKDDDDEDDEAELPPEYRRSHRGKPCGHVFNKGEGVHRCRTCGADPTCVFCSRCFYATNHDGHDTSFSISSKGGGCCDCGDPEAWKIPQHCKYHSPAAESGSESLQPLPKDLVSAMRTVIATSLDFILDTFADCPEDLTLPETVESIYNANGWEVPQEEEQHRAGKMPYTLSLWNDETHSFEEVINKVMETTGCSTAEAEEVAKAVDGYGRQIIKTSPNVEELLQIGNSINSIKLAVTIRTSREVFREHIAVVALEWIAGLANSVKSGPRPFQGVTYEAPDELVRSLISDELCSERRRIKPFLIASLGGKWVPREPDAEEKQIDEMERLEMVQRGWASSAVDSDAMVTDGGEGIPTATDPVMKDTTRIDFCLMYDMRLWKTPRAILREMYISTIIKSGEAYRKKLAERFALKFLRLSRAYLLLDREYDLSIINLSVQLFTVPTLASHLIQNTNIIDTLVTILKTYCLADIHPNVYPLDRFYTSFRKSQSTRIPHYARLEIRQNGPLMSDRRVDSVFNDLYFLLSSPKVRDELFKQLEALPRNPFPTFLDACAVWQAMNPQERAARQHVEYESQTWQAAINWSSQIWTLCQIVGQCYGPPAGTAGLTTRYLTYAPEQDTLHRFQESLKSFSSLLKVLRFTIARLDLWCEADQLHEVRKAGEKINAAITSAQALVSSGGSNAASIAAAAAAATGGMSKEAYDIVEFLEGIGVRSQTFRVATQATSFYLPMHWALGCLLMQLPRLSMLMRRVVKYSRLGNIPLDRLKSLLFAGYEEEGGSQFAHIAWGHIAFGLVRSHERIGATNVIVKDSYSMMTDPSLGKDTASSGGVGTSLPGNWPKGPSSATGLQSHGLANRDLKAVFTSGGSPDWIVEAARSGVWRSDRSLTPSEAFSKSPINYQERLARIIEYPLRVCVLLSQIRAGIWVRNGANMRSQAMYFRDLILRECNDTHVFLLQVGASAMGPTAFLTQVMNRFDLVEWFKGRMNHPTIFARIPGVDAQQVVSMVEDVLQLLIVVLTERGNVSGASVQSEMRKEIVHHLAVKKIGLPYSELTRRVPSTLVQWTDQGGVSGVEDEAMDPTSMWTFNDVLATVANFRAPEGASDTGLYELKEECYAEVDPWFWHYTRNQRMEVEEVLRARDDKRRKEVEEEYEKQRSRRSKQKATIDSISDILKIPDSEVWLPRILSLDANDDDAESMLDWQRQSWDAAQATVWNSVIDNPFVGLNDLAHSRVFSEILFFALSNVTKLPVSVPRQHVPQPAVPIPDEPPAVVTEPVRAMDLGEGDGDESDSEGGGGGGERREGFVTTALTQVLNRYRQLQERTQELAARATAEQQEQLQHQLADLQTQVQQLMFAGGLTRPGGGAGAATAQPAQQPSTTPQTTSATGAKLRNGSILADAIQLIVIGISLDKADRRQISRRLAKGRAVEDKLLFMDYATQHRVTVVRSVESNEGEGSSADQSGMDALVAAVMRTGSAPATSSSSSTSFGRMALVDMRMTLLDSLLEFGDRVRRYRPRWVFWGIHTWSDERVDDSLFYEAEDLAANEGARDQEEEDEDLKEQAARVLWILQQFEEYGDETAKLKVREWRKKAIVEYIEAAKVRRLVAGTAGTSMSDGADLEDVEMVDSEKSASTPAGKVLSEKEMKKRAALARKAAIMAQFAQQQKSFMEQHGEEFGDESEGVGSASTQQSKEKEAVMDERKKNERFWEYPSGTCMVCQEPAGIIGPRGEVNTAGSMVGGGLSPRAYGMLALTQTSYLLRQVDPDKQSDMLQTVGAPSGSDIPRTPPVAGEKISKAHPDNFIGGVYTSTCGHLMHVTCFQTYMSSIQQRHSVNRTRSHPENLLGKEFLCPLCKSLGNCLIPIVWEDVDHLGGAAEAKAAREANAPVTSERVNWYGSKGYRPEDLARKPGEWSDEVWNLGRWFWESQSGKGKDAGSEIGNVVPGDVASFFWSVAKLTQSRDVSAAARKYLVGSQTDSSGSQLREVPVNLFISWNGTVAQPPATWNERILRGLMRRAVRLREQGHGDDIQSSGDDDDDGNEDMNEDADEEMDVDDDPIVLVGPQDGIGMDGERDAFLAMMEDTETANAFVQLGMRLPPPHPPQREPPPTASQGDNIVAGGALRVAETVRGVLNTAIAHFMGTARGSSQTPTSPFAESGQTSDSTSTTDALHSDNSPQNREDGMHELTTWAYRGVPYKGDLIYRLYRERFVQIVNMKFARINANHDRGLDDMDLLWETYSYTLMCVEAMTRGVAPPNVPESAPWGARNLMRVSVLDTANAQMLSLLRLMSRTITTYSATLSSEKLAELISRSSYRARGLFYGVLEAPHIADRAVRIAGQAVTAYRSAEYSSSVVKGEEDLTFQKLMEGVDGSSCIIRETANVLIEMCFSLLPEPDVTFEALHKRQEGRDKSEGENGGWRSRLEPWVTARGDPFALIAIMWVMEITKVVIHQLASIAMRDCEGLLSPEVSTVAQKMLDDFGLRLDFELYDRLREDREAEMESEGNGERLPETTDDILKNMREFMLWVMVMLGMDEQDRIKVLRQLHPAVVVATIRNISLSYLRTAALLLYTRFHVVPPGGITGFFRDENTAASAEQYGKAPIYDGEFETLLAYLNLPSVSVVCSRRTMEDPFLSRVIAGWCMTCAVGETLKNKDTNAETQSAGGTTSSVGSGEVGTQEVQPTSTTVRRGSNSRGASSATPGSNNNSELAKRLSGGYMPAFSIPGTYELITLPQRMDVLFNEWLTFICPECGTRPADPALCLICGQFVCFQSFCCSKQGEGECNSHMISCGGSVGVYLSLRQCTVLFLHGPGVKKNQGCFHSGPYLDPHGEIDIGLRRGRPMTLNQRRYDEIRRLWLTHSIPSVVARRIEQNYDMGGWPTL